MGLFYLISFFLLIYLGVVIVNACCNYDVIKSLIFSFSFFIIFSSLLVYLFLIIQEIVKIYFFNYEVIFPIMLSFYLLVVKIKNINIFTKLDFDVKKYFPLFIILLFTLVIVIPRIEHLTMDADVGIYLNRANQILHEKKIFSELELLDSFKETEYYDLYIKDNFVSSNPNFLNYQPGTFVFKDNNIHKMYFHGLPFWSISLSIFGFLFGVENQLYLMVFMYIFIIFLFYYIFERMRIEGNLTLLLLLFIATNPVLIYFSKYHTTELSLLFYTLLMIYFLLNGMNNKLYILCASFSFFIISLTHVAALFYIPIFVISLVFVHSMRYRLISLFTILASSFFILSLGINIFVSRMYFFSQYKFMGLLNNHEISIFLALLFVVIILIFSVLIYFNSRSKILHKVSMFFYYENLTLRIIVIFITIITLLLAIRNSYLLGWTDKFVPTSVLEFTAWNMRSLYANKGWLSLLHTPLFSILQLFSFFIFIVLIISFFICDFKKISSYKKIFIYSFLYFYFLSIFIWKDIPYNYYPSRYFLYLLFPLLIISFAIILNKYRTRRVFKGLLILIFLSIIVFNIPKSVVIFKAKPSFNAFSFVHKVAQETSDKDAVFIVGDKYLYWGLNFPLKYSANKFIVRIPHDSQDQFTLIEKYAKILKAKNISILSDKRLDLNRGFKIINYSSNKLEETIVYPQNFTSQDLSVYLYDYYYNSLLVEDDTLFLKDITSDYISGFYLDGWTSGNLVIDKIDFKLNDSNLLKIELGNHYSRIAKNIFGKSLEELVSVKVNYKEVELVDIVDNSLIVDLRGFTFVDKIQILSTTFVPKNLNFNNDTRELGVDIISIKFINNN